MTVKKLLEYDSEARDPLYNRVQEDDPWFDPPSLVKDRIEEMWRICCEHADRNFRSHIKSDFPARYSELYFCSVFKSRLGFSIGSRESDRGLDFYLEDLKCWAEVTTLSSGDPGSPNSVPELKTGISRPPRRQIILRMTSSFKDKADKIRKDIENDVIGNNQPIVICISGGWIGSLDRFPRQIQGGFPEIVEALLPIGHMKLLLDRESMKITGIDFEYRESVHKIRSDGGSEDVETNYFIDEKYAHISAVIYSYADATDVLDVKDMGNDFFIIHNPLARNPLPVGSIRCGVEYAIQLHDNTLQIKTINHSKDDS